MDGRWMQDTNFSGQGNMSSAMTVTGGGFTQEDNLGRPANYTGPLYQPVFQDEVHWELTKRDRIVQEELIRQSQSDAPLDLSSYVERLWYAVHNVDDIVDKPCKDNKLCQAAHRIRSGFYPPKAIQSALWNLVVLCRTSAMGINLVDKHHGAKFELDHQTFDARMDAIIDACRQSKALCKQILDPNFSERLADAPLHELKSKYQNKRINHERDIQNSLGRELLKLKSGIEVRPDEDDNVGGENMSIATPHSSRPNHAATFRTPVRMMGSPSDFSTSKRKKFDRMNLGERHDSDDENDDEHWDGSPVNHKRSRSSRVGKVPGDIKLSPNSARILNKRILDARGKSIRVTASAEKSDLVSFETDHKLRAQRVETNMKYRVIICNALRISHEFAEQFDLYNLRFYARAYNIQHANDVWSYTDNIGNTGEHYGRKSRLYRSSFSSFSSLHFALVIKHFRPLAVARGDLHEDFTFNEHGGSMIDASQDVQLQKVLGMIKNDFNLVNWTPARRVLSPGAQAVGRPATTRLTSTNSDGGINNIPKYYNKQFNSNHLGDNLYNMDETFGTSTDLDDMHIGTSLKYIRDSGFDGGHFSTHANSNAIDQSHSNSRFNLKDSMFKADKFYDGTVRDAGLEIDPLYDGIFPNDDSGNAFQYDLDATQYEDFKDFACGSGMAMATSNSMHGSFDDGDGMGRNDQSEALEDHHNGDYDTPQGGSRSFEQL